MIPTKDCKSLLNQATIHDMEPRNQLISGLRTSKIISKESTTVLQMSRSFIGTLHDEISKKTRTKLIDIYKLLECVSSDSDDNLDQTFTCDPRNTIQLKRNDNLKIIEKSSCSKLNLVTQQLSNLHLGNQISGEPITKTETSCSYCGISEPDCLVFCNRTQKWFCNGTQKSSLGSHIITHLARARANEVMLHKSGPHKDRLLKCSICGATNVFQLGFVPSASGSFRLVCRTTCSDSDQKELAHQILDNWKPIIESRKFIAMIVNVPSKVAQIKARQISPEQIDELEKLWTKNPNATIKDIKPITSVGIISPVQLKYKSALEYCRTYSALLKLEASEDKSDTELIKFEKIRLHFEDDITSSPVVYFKISERNDGLEKDIAIGDEVTIIPTNQLPDKYSFVGIIFLIPDDDVDKFGAKLMNNPKNLKEFDTFTIQLNWRQASFSRMKAALEKVLIGSYSVPQFLISRLLGQDVEDQKSTEKLPIKLSAPQLPELNESQSMAIRTALEHRLCLIQGPPGTGKTVTAATIVYHLWTVFKGKVLAVAPSNTAIDQLCEKISATGLNVVRICSRSREDMPSPIRCLMLHEQALHLPGYEDLLQLHKERSKQSSWSGSKEILYQQLKKRAEAKVLYNASVVCCTCVMAGDKRLEDLEFESVLVDESTQAVEPECLIPLTNGSKHIVLVGDHCQLGPVVKCRKAAEAGFGQSMFERFVRLGVPSNRLEIQYRMHPIISEFSSRVFYEGRIQNGVSQNERTQRIDFPWPNCEQPTFFYRHVGDEEISANGKSLLNQSEAIIVGKFVWRFLKAGVNPDSIGVIVPYDGQRTFVRQYLKQTGSGIEKTLCKNIKIDSVDAFQGREKDFIILSCVRCNRDQQIGFLREPRRLNVALTRARYGLIIVGDPSTLCKDHLWNELLHFYYERKLLVEGQLNGLTQYNLPSLKFPVPYVYQPCSNFGDQFKKYYKQQRKKERKTNKTS